MSAWTDRGGAVAMIAALEREVSGLVRGWEHRQPARHVHLWLRGAAVVACAGMGESRVTLAVEAAMAAAPVKRLISVGVAGACDPELRAGDVVRAASIVSARTGERLETAEPGVVVVSVDQIAGVAEKQRLRASYAAGAVEMEAATVARLATAHGLGFAAIKAISDPAEFELEALNHFADDEGQFRTGAFVAHLALRPALWPRLRQLAANGDRALAALTRALEAELNESR